MLADKILLLKKYIHHEDSHDLQEFNQLVFNFESEKELRAYVKEGWGKVEFMDEVLLFLEEVMFIRDSQAKQKFKAVCESICSLLCPEVCHQSWFRQYQLVLG